ncbi:IclR family transcriptional regulator [Massilia sp. Root351]|jgi:IclR family pca regulon transcriptional regulator|uniref:IclR family transcriptional regulator domain-containing protein n=1 Tax=Massilia sp. Root351 TaxID=1736522 RepID=UPI00070C6531|nr:IclR family transcriptional regulator [Massilia sp. Root351]
MPKTTKLNAGEPSPELDHQPEPQREPTISEQIDALTDPSFMTSLARGLAVLQAFSDSRKPQTIANISQKTGIPRAAVRRCLHTLRELGYVDAELNNFSLRPKVLTLGYSYLSSTPLTVSAQPYLNSISRTLNESSSLAVLDDGEVLYVARAATSRVMSVALNTGSRLPAYCTSLGRVMLAHLPPKELDQYLATTRLKPMTENTVVNQKRLRDILAGVRQAGYAINDEELELGLRSIAVPVRGASGSVLAALNVGAQASRVSVQQLEQEFLPVLLRGAQELSILLP